MENKIIDKLWAIEYNQCVEEKMSYKITKKVSLITGVAKSHKIVTTNLLEIYIIKDNMVIKYDKIFGNFKEILEKLETYNINK